VVFTAAVQSSTAATLTVIGFVSAGLVTFQQAVGVIVGATLGTTTTPWMVAFFGFRVSVSAGALPLLGVGALLWLIAKGKLRSFGAILAGFGLLFTGIDFLQIGMAGISWNLDGIAGHGPGAMWILAGIGVAMTIVMQSSSAAAATTVVALHAGSLTFEQGCAMIVGQSVGSAATTALVAIGGGLAVRRSALAHVSFSTIVAVLGMLFLGPLTAAADWVGARLDDPDGVLALAAFSSIFKLAGIVVFYPWLGRFSDLIVRISGTGRHSAVGRLSRSLRKRAEGWRSKPPGGRQWRSRTVRSAQSRTDWPATRSPTIRRWKRSSRSSTSSSRSRWRLPISPPSAPGSSGSVMRWIT